MTKLDWTHLDVMIEDIRKLNKLYVLKLRNGGLPILDPFDTKQPELKEPITSSLFVSDKIFEERLKSYFLKDISQIERKDILNVQWNMYITKGYYVKVEDNDVVRHDQDSNKYYVSYLEIAGPLGSFCSIYRDKELNKS